MTRAERDERFTLELVTIGGAWREIPASERLARFLRAAGRSYGLRCVAVVPGATICRTLGAPSEPPDGTAECRERAGKVRLQV